MQTYPRRPWTPSDMRVLFSMQRALQTPAEIAECLGSSVHAVRIKIREHASKGRLKTCARVAAERRVEGRDCVIRYRTARGLCAPDPIPQLPSLPVAFPVVRTEDGKEVTDIPRDCMSFREIREVDHDLGYIVGGWE
ncbi:hypothetical protein LDL36_13850 [Komagataeibacter sp. FNDCR1]|nr:hypothetical protein [Komagataeibacter sp. FNDCR1]